MRRWILFIGALVLLTASTAVGQDAGDLLLGPKHAYLGSGNKNLDPLYLWAYWMQNQVGSLSSVGTGETFYVDSNVTNAGDGSTWTKAVATVAEAVALCTADRGDIVRVAEGHAENLSGATSLKITTAGVRVVGCGTGTNRPTFTVTGTAGLVHLNAANVLFENCNIVCGVDNATTLAKIQGDNSGFLWCDFYEGGDDGDMNGVTGITVGVADKDSDNFIIAGCNLYLPTATRWNQGIVLAKDMVGGRIIGTKVVGDFANAAIDIPEAGNAQVDLLIDRCWLENHETGDHALQANGTGNTGIVRDTVMVADGASTTVDAGGLQIVACPYAVYANDSDSDVWTFNITTNNLDHLAKTAVANNSDLTTEVVDNTVLAHIMAGGDTSTFAPATMSLKQIAADAASAKTAAEKIDTNTELRTLIFGSDTAGATAAALATVQLGQPIYISNADVNCSDGTVDDIFTVAGGDIIVHYLAFTFTEAASANACTMGFTWDPTAGAGTDTPIASGVDVQGVAIGSTVWAEGDASAAVVAAIGTKVPEVGINGGFIIGPGGIDLEMGSADLTTGIGTAKMIYTPLSSGVTVAAP